MGSSFIGGSSSDFESDDDWSSSSSSENGKAFPLVSDDIGMSMLGEGKSSEPVNDEKSSGVDDNDEGDDDDARGYELDPDEMDRLKLFVDNDEYNMYILRSNNFKRYARSIKRSGGFDIVDYPGVCCFTDVAPITYLFEDPKQYDYVAALAEKGIRYYNAKHGKAYEFDSLVKANGCFVQGIIYYITFLAKEANDVDSVGPPQSKTFRARVYVDIGRKPVVEYCAIFKSLGVIDGQLCTSGASKRFREGSMKPAHV